MHIYFIAWNGGGEYRKEEEYMWFRMLLCGIPSTVISWNIIRNREIGYVYEIVKIYLLRLLVDIHILYICELRSVW